MKFILLSPLRPSENQRSRYEEIEVIFDTSEFMDLVSYSQFQRGMKHFLADLYEDTTVMTEEEWNKYKESGK